MAMTTPDRARLIKIIHVAKRELQMDDDAYRDLLQSVVGKRSTSDMNAVELQQLFNHLKACGFKVKPTQPGRKRAIPLDPYPQSRKIRALWLQLADMGVVRDASELALGKWIKRETGVEALAWLDGTQASQAIEKLKKWTKRIERQRGITHG